MNHNPPGSSVHGIFQARIMEWVAIPFSRGSSWPRDRTLVSCIGRRVLYHWAIREAPLASIVVQSLSHVNSLWPHGLQHSRLKFMYTESMMLSNRLIFCCLLLLCLQSFPALGSFSMSRLLTSGGQSIGASASILSMNIQDWFPLGLTGLVSLLSKGLWRVFFRTTIQRHQFFHAQPFLWSSFHIHTWLLEKP